MVAFIIGVVSVLAGFGFRIYGNHMNRSALQWLNNFMNNGTLAPGLLWIDIGNALIVVGIIVCLLGIFLMNKGGSRKRHVDPDDDDVDDDDVDDDF